jgi:hypothetical protein
MDERDGRIAFVGELPDADDSFRLAGVFGVHWESLDGNEHAEGPEGVPVEEAIAWGRRHARFVSVRLGDSGTFYSAGEGNIDDLGSDADDPDDEPALPWPADGMIVRPRPIGAPLDGSVQEVDWSIESTAANVPAGDDGLARVRARLERDGRLRAVELSQSDGEVRMRCVVKAHGGGPAVMTVHDAFAHAMDEVFPDRRPRRGYAGGDSTCCLGPVRAR